jgi:YD repeat-containing protein
MTEMILPLGSIWSYAYDPDGNLVSQVDANGNASPEPGDGTTTYSYDRAGRLVGIDYSDSTPDVSFSYDAVGNRVQMTDGQGTQTYAYDSVSRLTGVSRGQDTFSYLYDLAGNITRRGYPDGTIVDSVYGQRALRSRRGNVARVTGDLDVLHCDTQWPSRASVS